jgi:hypothetical protein
VSDISLDYGFFSTLILSLFLAWPGVVGGAAIGAAIGALASTARRMLGGALGCVLGALLGWGIGVLGYMAWALSDLSVSVDFSDAIVLALERAAPGLLVGAAIGGAAWRARRSLGAIFGALAGGALSATLWFALIGGR